MFCFKKCFLFFRNMYFCILLCLQKKNLISQFIFRKNKFYFCRRIYFHSLFFLKKCPCIFGKIYYRRLFCQKNIFLYFRKNVFTQFVLFFFFRKMSLFFQKYILVFRKNMFFFVKKCIVVFLFCLFQKNVFLYFKKNVQYFIVFLNNVYYCRFLERKRNGIIFFIFFIFTFFIFFILLLPLIGYVNLRSKNYEFIDEKHNSW